MLGKKLFIASAKMHTMLKHTGRSINSPSFKSLIQGFNPNINTARFLSSANNESFLSGSSANYVESMYYAWKENPLSVHKSWDIYFRNVEGGVTPGQAYSAPPTLSPGSTAVFSPSVSSAGGRLDMKGVQDHLNIQLLIRSYQVIIIFFY